LGAVIGSELIKYNYNLDPEYIRPGQVLAVPTVRGAKLD